MDATWISVGFGVALGVTYGAASFLSLRSAQGKAGSAFLKIALGGMIIRLFVAAGLIAAILILAPVNPLLFAGTFFGMYILILVAEVYFLHTHVPTERNA